MEININFELKKQLDFILKCYFGVSLENIGNIKIELKDNVINVEDNEIKMKIKYKTINKGKNIETSLYIDNIKEVKHNE